MVENASREQLIEAYKKLKLQATETVRKNKALVVRCKADRKLLFMFLAELFGETPQTLASQNLKLSDLKHRLKERDDMVLKRSDGDDHVEELKTQIQIQKSQLRALFEEKQKNESCDKCQQLSTCQELLEKSRSDTANIVGKLKGVVAKCKQLQFQKKELETKLESASGEQSNVMNEDVLKKLQEKCDTQVVENTKLVNKLRQIVAKFKAHQNEYTKCREREESATALVSKLRSEVEQLRNRLASTDDSNDTSSEMQKKYEERIENMKRNSLETRERMEKLKIMLEKLEREKDVATKELENSKTIMTGALDSTTAKFKEKIQSISNSLRHEKECSLKLEKKLKVLKLNESDNAEEKMKLCEERDNAVTKLSEMQEKYSENTLKLKAGIQKLKQERDDLERSKTSIESELNGKIQSVSNLLQEEKTKSSELSKELHMMRTSAKTELTKSLEDAAEEKMKLCEERDNAVTKLSEMQVEIQNLKVKIQSQSETLRVTNKERTKFLEKLRALQKEQSSSKPGEDLKALKKKYVALQEKAKSAASQLSDVLKNNEEQMTGLRERVKKQTETFQDKFNAQRSEIETLNEELEASRSRYSNMRQTHESTLENNRHVHAEAQEAFEKFSETALERELQADKRALEGKFELQEERTKYTKMKEELETLRESHELALKSSRETLLSKQRESHELVLESLTEEREKAHELELSRQRETYEQDLAVAVRGLNEEWSHRESSKEAEWTEAHEEKLSEMKDATRTLNEQNIKLKKKLKAGWNQFEKLKESYELLQNQKNGKKEEEGLIDVELNEKLKNRIREQMENVEELRSRVEEAQDELAKAEQTFEVEKNKLLVSSQEQRAENKRLMQLLGKTRSESKSHVEQLEEEKNALAVELRFVTKKLESEESKNTEVEKLKQRLHVLDQEREEHLEDLKKTDLSIIREVKAEKETELVILRESLNKERQRVEQFKQKLRDVVKMCQNYKQANAALKQSCSDAQRQVEIGKAQIIKLSQLMSMR